MTSRRSLGERYLRRITHRPGGSGASRRPAGTARRSPRRRRTARRRSRSARRPAARNPTAGSGPGAAVAAGPIARLARYDHAETTARDTTVPAISGRRALTGIASSGAAPATPRRPPRGARGSPRRPGWRSSRAAPGLGVADSTGPDRHFPDRVAGGVRLDHLAAADHQGDVAGCRPGAVGAGVEDQVSRPGTGYVPLGRPLRLRGARRYRPRRWSRPPSPARSSRSTPSLSRPSSTAGRAAAGRRRWPARRPETALRRARPHRRDRTGQRCRRPRPGQRRRAAGPTGTCGGGYGKKWRASFGGLVGGPGLVASWRLRPGRGS